jgi:acetyltransferase-like isoleucine patch superfamily enzyme
METTAQLKSKPQGIATQVKAWLKDNPLLKSAIHRLLIPKGQAEPRWFTKWMINPFFHSVNRKARIKRTARLDVFPFNDFAVGPGSTIEDYAVVNNGVGDVRIGKETRIGIGNVIMGPIQIGDKTILGQHVLVTGLDHRFEDPDLAIKDQGVNTKETRIGDGTFIGANVCILPGVNIGNHSVVGAGSVVTKSIPDYCVAIENQAQPVKKYDFERKQWIKLN